MNGTLSAINKLEAVERQLEAALYLHLRCFPPEPVHTLISAARGILYGLAKQNENIILAKWDRDILSRVVGKETKRQRDYQNEVANFLKHADRDPSGELAVPNLVALNVIELQLCVVALTQIKHPISQKLDKGLWFLGLSENGILPFEAILAEYRSVLSNQQIQTLQNKDDFRIALIQWFEAGHP